MEGKNLWFLGVKRHEDIKRADAQVGQVMGVWSDLDGSPSCLKADG